MNMLLTILVLLGFVFSMLQSRPAAQRKAQPWRARVIWVPPGQTGDVIVDQRNLCDRSKWMRIHVNQAWQSARD